MNMLSKTIITVATLLACGSAFAGRDEALINATRKNQLAHDAKLAQVAGAATASAASVTTAGAHASASAVAAHEHSDQ